MDGWMDGWMDVLNGGTVLGFSDECVVVLLAGL
jgi:hypothetical protein